MALYITRAALEINGSSVTDFKGFTEKAITPSKRVNLMYKSGNANLTKRYDIDLDYVVPQTGAFDFSVIKNSTGTLTVEYDNGSRDDWGGVSVVEVGDAAIDGENELVKKITLMAETKNGDTGA